MDVATGWYLPMLTIERSKGKDMQKADRTTGGDRKKSEHPRQTEQPSSPFSRNFAKPYAE